MTFKKIIPVGITMALLLILTGCQKPRPVPDGFRLPTEPPNPAALQPSYGPNDPASPAP